MASLSDRLLGLAPSATLAMSAKSSELKAASGPCSISQKAALAALDSDQQCVETMRQAFQRRRDLIVRLCRRIPGLEVNEPQGAFYLFPKCSSYFGKKYGDRVIGNSTDFAMFVLEVGRLSECLSFLK